MTPHHFRTRWMKFEYAKLRIPRVWLDRNLSRAREAKKLNVVRDLMREFGESTGLTSGLRSGKRLPERAVDEAKCHHWASDLWEPQV